MAREFDYSFKLLVLGDSGVGKTCFIMRYVDQKYVASYISTIGIDSKVKAVSFNGLRVRLQIWDTAGQERFRTLTSAYYRGAMGILLLYDVTSTRSFENVRGWLQNIEEHAAPDVVRLLAGNKKDMDNQREVLVDQGKKLAAQYGIPFFETSAKSGENVEDCVLEVAKLIYDQKQRQEKRLAYGAGQSPEPSDNKTVDLNNQGTQTEGGCAC